MISIRPVKFPIRQKLIILTILPIILIYLIISIIQLNMGLAVTKEKASYALAESVDRHAKECEIAFMAASKVAHGLANYMIMRPPESIDQITSFIELILAENPNIVGSAVAFAPDAFPHLPRTSKDGYLAPYLYRKTEIIDTKKAEKIVYRDLAHEYRYTECEWYVEPAKTLKSGWTEPYFDQGGGDVFMCTYAVPFFVERQFAGVAKVDITLESIRAIITNVTHNDSDYLLCSHTGRIIVAPKHPEWEMEETIGTLADKYHAEVLRNVGKKMVRGEAGTYLAHSAISGKRVFGAFTPLETIGWSLLNRTPESVTLRSVYIQFWVSTIIFSCGLFLFIFVILLVSQRITQPLKQLLPLVQDLSAGKWDVEITGINSRDEIAELAQAFNAMAKTLRKSIDESVRTTTAKKIADAANKAKSQFLATMSHEMRTPLNGVIGISRLLMETKLQQKQLEYAKLIKVSGESLLFLINDILDFSKIEAGKFDLSRSVFNLHSTLEAVVGILSARTEEKQLELVVTFKRDVPRWVYGDEGRLRQILINLVGNALKFTDEGGVHIHVALIGQTERQYNIRFDIIDTGIGIPVEQQDRLFKLFSQIKNPSTQSGTGLGLAISKKLVELMGGEISVTSEAGKGATFSFNILLDAESNAAEETNEMPTKVTAKMKGQSVLIVSNNKFQCPVLFQQFELWNFHPQTAGTAKDAMRVLQQAAQMTKPFFMVIVDTHLADSEGTDLIKMIQNEDKLAQTPIIFLTPLSDTSNLKDWKYPEKLQLISKPVQSSALYNAMIFLCSGIKTKGRTEESFLNIGSSAESPLRVLVAEDNHINQIVIAEICNNAGIDCAIVPNGAEAFEKVKSGEQFDAVLMDCQMPVMNGFEAVQRIREWESQMDLRPLPIIALTANVTVEDELKCLAVGMDTYCPKPVEPKRIITLLREWTKKER